MRSNEALEKENKLLCHKLACALRVSDSFIALADEAQLASVELKKIVSEVQAMNIKTISGD